MKYEGKHTNQISFPLGGIGTGSIGLSGTGRLMDWEIFGRPNKESYNGYSHFAIKVEKDNQVLDARVLNGDLPPHYIGNVKTHWLHSGYGFGPDQITMAGFPHFRKTVFTGEFPLASIDFKDEDFASPVRLTAFNPFIPGDDFHSSIPAAYFEFTIQNPTDEALDYTIALSVQNPTGLKKIDNHFLTEETGHFLNLTCEEFPDTDHRYGNVCIASDCPDVSYQEYWYRGGWSDGIETFWRDFTAGGPLKNRRYTKDFATNQQLVYDVSTLAAHRQISGKSQAALRFVISWYYPNMIKHWEHKYHPEKRFEDAPVWKHYYASMFSSSLDCARYALKNYSHLYKQTKLFKDALFSSSLPDEEKDAISSNLSTLKSATVLRLSDGQFYGFEGCIADSGCCEGSCQHVWNYAYALPFLFPKLERSMRELEFRYSMRNDGRMSFRLQLPLGTSPDDFRACVDGQMGAVIKAFREWKISGDTDWLKRLWPSIEKALDYAWADTNEDLWDSKQTGVITGRQHHTLDMELFGANSWLESFYLCALKAGAEMSKALGYTEKANMYRELFSNGKKWSEEHLFNGEYFQQWEKDLSFDALRPFAEQLCLHGDKTVDIYWNEEAEQIKYQIGSGCMIDQVIGQWHANNCGLGEVFDYDKTVSALNSIYKYNYHPSMRNVTNTWRLYSINDEGGVMICTWPPEKEKPAIPLTYNSETMHGFEYQVASHMIQEHMLEEAHNIVVSIRQKYDGYKRNPYNEIECGSNYARSMASYGLLLAYSGFQYDLTKGCLGFFPAVTTPGAQFFWSIDGAWGMFEIPDSNTVRITVLSGELNLKSFSCLLFKENSVSKDGFLLEKSSEDTVSAEFSASPEKPLVFTIIP